MKILNFTKCLFLKSIEFYQVLSTFYQVLQNGRTFCHCTNVFRCAQTIHNLWMICIKSIFSKNGRDWAVFEMELDVIQIYGKVVNFFTEFLKSRTISCACHNIIQKWTFGFWFVIKKKQWIIKKRGNDISKLWTSKCANSIWMKSFSDFRWVLICRNIYMSHALQWVYHSYNCVSYPFYYTTFAIR